MVYNLYMFLFIDYKGGLYMGKSTILVSNEREANKFASRIMLVTVSFVVLVYILNVIGIFIVPAKTMNIAVICSTILLLVPSFIVFVLKKNGPSVKYIIVTVASLMIFCLSTLLTYHVVILYIYTMAISSLYFSRKVSWYAVIISLITLSSSQILSMYVEGVVDRNFTELYDLVIYGVIPRGLQLFAISLIFIILSKRTKRMLENVMSSEERQVMYDKMMSITDKTLEVSNTLAASVKQLSETTESTSVTSEAISNNAKNIASGAENTLEFVNEATSLVVNVSNRLKEIVDKNMLIVTDSREINDMTETNRIKIGNASSKMKDINDVTNESKEIIAGLGQRSNEINQIVEVITDISEQTNLLALNAAIESARAGEHGTGFAVVAEEVRKLAVQSKEAAENISYLIQSVLEDTEKGIEAMDRSSSMAKEGLVAIEDVNSAFGKVSEAIKEMNDRLEDISSITENLSSNGDEITGIVQQIRDINYTSLNELKGIAQSTEEQLAAMHQVNSAVDSIDRIAEELLEIESQR